MTSTNLGATIDCVRKSTEDKDRQILNIKAQLVECKEFTAKEKLEIVGRLSLRPKLSNNLEENIGLNHIWKKENFNHMKKYPYIKFLPALIFLLIAATASANEWFSDAEILRFTFRSLLGFFH